MMMNRLLTGVAVTALSLACITPVLASGGSRTAMQKQVEMSMLLSGTIDVKPDGSVAGYRIDQADSLPEGVTRLLGNNIPQWTFEPVVAGGGRWQAGAGPRAHGLESGRDPGWRRQARSAHRQRQFR